jgi:hypothetical protein
MSLNGKKEFLRGKNKEADEALARDGGVFYIENNMYERIRIFFLQGLERLFLERKERGLSNHVLELFGPGSERYNPDFDKADSWHGVTLVDHSERLGGNVKFIPTNLYKPSSYRKIREILSKDGLEGVDIILCNPVGPFQKKQTVSATVPETLSIYYGFLKKIYRMLREQGEIYSQIPSHASKNHDIILERRIMESFVEVLNTLGVAVEMRYNVFRAIKIVKTNSAPEVLPAMKIEGDKVIVVE